MHEQQRIYKFLVHHHDDPAVVQMREQGILTLCDFIPSMGGRNWLGLAVTLPETPNQKLLKAPSFRQLCG